MKSALLPVFSSVPVPENFKAHFKFEGRTYRLFKRSQTQDASWWIEFERKGRRVVRSLDTNLQRNATDNAKILISAVRAENWSVIEATKLRNTHSTLGEIITVFIRESGTKSAPAYVRCFKNVIRRALGQTVNIENLSSTALNADLVRKFKDDADAQHGEEEKAKRTANSLLNQARSMFSPHALELYHNARLRLPDLTPFLKTPRFRAVAKKDYQVPNDALVEQTFAALDQLKTTDRNAYLAICLACGAGLRRGEIGQARRIWFIQRDGQRYLKSSYVTKNNQTLDVPILEDWWQRIHAVDPDANPEDFILQGSPCERTSTAFARVGQWMRALGWTTQKCIHEFRAYVGSKIAEKYGIETASYFLRHSDLRVTRKYYMRYLKLQHVEVTFGQKAQTP